MREHRADGRRSERAGRRALRGGSIAVLLAAAVTVAPAPTVAWAADMVVESTAARLVELDDAAAAEVESLAAAALHEAGGPGGAADARAAAGPPAEAAPARPLRSRRAGLRRFVSIGFSWRGAPSPGRFRVHGPQGWTSWRPIGVEDDHAPDLSPPDSGRAAAGGAEAGPPSTEPVWVAGADGYELDVPAGAEGVEVHLVREGAKRVRLATATAKAGAAAAAPDMAPRAAWGARPANDRLSAARAVRFAVVHHAGGGMSNSYGPDEVPGLLRSIQAYHQDVRGWSDIGYNFAVDRFGRVWEGRGGAASAVIGAHAQGFNTGSTGVVLLGDFGASAPSNAAVAAAARLIGWRLFRDGAHPQQLVTTVSRGSAAFATGAAVEVAGVVGHRDVQSTDCPSDSVHASLDALRAAAAAEAASFLGRGEFDGAGAPDPLPGAAPSVGDFDGDGRADVLWSAPGGPAEVWYSNSGGFDRRPVGRDGSFRPIVGDFDADGAADVFWLSAAHAVTAVFYGRRDRGFDVLGNQPMGGAVDAVSGDWDGDGDGDIVFFAPGGAAQVWWGLHDRGFYPEQTVRERPGDPLTGDFNGDGRQDIFWFDRGPGEDSVWFGAQDTFVRSVLWAEGAFRPAPADIDGDGRTDIIWLAGGRHVSWRFTRNGLVDRWADDAGEPVIGDFDGGGVDDVLWVSGNGVELELNRRDGGGDRRAVDGDGGGGPAGMAADFDGDGLDDVLWWGDGGASVWRSH